MSPMLNTIMNDGDLHPQMIDLISEHQDFMNVIRHINSETEYIFDI